MDGWEMGLEGNCEGAFLLKKDFMDWLWRIKGVYARTRLYL